MILEQAKFDQMRGLLDDMYAKDDQTRDIVSRAGLTSDQLKIVNLLIIQALRYYDALKEGGEFTVR
ncbi:MAG: hypothetical protein HFF69_06245 [Oscillospiraceae bacterium]|jgi:hypothetical protein|nr:hypothetical protein [Oscillospiraceae bacterium]